MNNKIIQIVLALAIVGFAAFAFIDLRQGGKGFGNAEFAMAADAAHSLQQLVEVKQANLIRKQEYLQRQLPQCTDDTATARMFYDRAVAARILALNAQGQQADFFQPYRTAAPEAVVSAPEANNYNAQLASYTERMNKLQLTPPFESPVPLNLGASNQRYKMSDFANSPAVIWQFIDPLLQASLVEMEELSVNAVLPKLQCGSVLDVPKVAFVPDQRVLKSGEPATGKVYLSKYYYTPRLLVEVSEGEVEMLSPTEALITIPATQKGEMTYEATVTVPQASNLQVLKEKKSFTVN